MLKWAPRGTFVFPVIKEFKKRGKQNVLYYKMEGFPHLPCFTELRVAKK